MQAGGRLVAAVLAVVVVGLGLVVGSRMTAGADTAPRDTTPIVVTGDPAPTEPAATPTPTPSAEPSPARVTPELRDDDDDDGPDDDDDARDDDDDDGGDDDLDDD